MPLGGILASALGTVAGGEAAEATSGGDSNPDEAVLQDLETAADDEIASAQQAAETDITGGELSTDELQNMYETATNAITDYYNQGIDDMAPYVANGLEASDAYLQSMGLPTVTGGSESLEQALQANTAYQNQVTQYNQAVNAAGGSSGYLPASIASQIASGNYTVNPSSITNAGSGASNLTGSTTGATTNQLSAANFQSALNGIFNGSTPTSLFNSSQLGTGQNAEQLYNTATQYAQTAQNVINQQGSNLKDASQYTSDEAQLNALLQQYQGGFTATPTAPTNPLTAAQQAQVAAYNSGNTSAYTTPTTNPLSGFAASGAGAAMNYNANQSLYSNFVNNNPGYMFQQQQGINGITNSASASGLLNNPNYQTALGSYVTGLANQSYNTYQTNLNSAFQNYQNSLLSASNQGQAAATTNSNNATTAGTETANAATSTGSAISGVDQSTASNVASAQLAQGSAAANYQTQAASLAAQQAGSNASLAGLGAGSSSTNTSSIGTNYTGSLSSLL